MHPYHTLKVSGSLLLSLFKVCGMPGATLSHFEGSLLLSLFEVRGMPGAPLTHFEGVRINFT